MKAVYEVEGCAVGFVKEKEHSTFETAIKLRHFCCK
jgi:hypothetical protein